MKKYFYSGLIAIVLLFTSCEIDNCSCRDYENGVEVGYFEFEGSADVDCPTSYSSYQVGDTLYENICD